MIRRDIKLLNSMAFLVSEEAHATHATHAFVYTHPHGRPVAQTQTEKPLLRLFQF